MVQVVIVLPNAVWSRGKSNNVAMNIQRCGNGNWRLGSLINVDRRYILLTRHWNDAPNNVDSVRIAYRLKFIVVISLISCLTMANKSWFEWYECTVLNGVRSRKQRKLLFDLQIKQRWSIYATELCCQFNCCVHSSTATHNRLCAIPNSCFTFFFSFPRKLLVTFAGREKKTHETSGVWQLEVCLL